MDEKNYTHIRDGFTRRGYINGLDESGRRLSGELRFTYRPMLAEQREAVRRIMRDEKGAKLDVLFSTAVAGQIVDWSATDDGGQPVPVSVAAVRRLPPNLYDAVYLVMIGSRPSDPEPNQTQEEAVDYASLLRRSAESGVAPGELALAEQQKN